MNDQGDTIVTAAPAGATAESPAPAEASQGTDEARPIMEAAGGLEAHAEHPEPAHHVPSSQLRHDLSAIRHTFETGEFPYATRISERTYLEHVMPLQVELLKLQNWVKQTHQKIVVIFEGRDAAGKGGTIKRFMEHLNPRGARIVALEKPTENERTQWYFQRYIEQLPSGGEIVFFDRSWYNRAACWCAPASGCSSSGSR